MSHPYMISGVDGEPPRPVHREILEEEQARVNHVVCVLSACHLIIAIRRVGI